MAYELGLLCAVPEGTSPEGLVRALCDSLEPVPALLRWRHGESWAACEAELSPSNEPVSMQANIDDDLVARIAIRAANEGVLDDPVEFQAVITIRLVGEVDWVPIRALIRAGIEEWRGILFDDVAGFGVAIN